RAGITGFLLWLIIGISLAAGPIALLVFFQFQFLPYHSEWITWWQRIVIVIDLILLWILWPRVARGKTVGLGWSDFKRVRIQLWLLVSFMPVLLVVTIATFPGELVEKHVPSLSIIPTHWPTLGALRGHANNLGAKFGSMGWTSPHELLVAGEVNYVTGRPQSL